MMIVRELWREAARFPTALACSVLLLVLVFATHVGQAVAIAWAMSAVLGGNSEGVLAALATICGIVVTRCALNVSQTHAATKLGAKVRLSLRRRVIAAALVPSRLHDTSVRDGSMRASLVDGIEGINSYVSRYIPAIAQVVIVCPAVAIAIGTINPWAGLGVGSAIVLSLMGPLAWKRMMSRRGLDHWDSYESLSADVLESLRHMATLRTLGDVRGTRQRLHHRSEALRRATERVMRGSLAETGVTDFAIQSGVVLAAMVAIVHAVRGDAPSIEVYLILMLSSEAFRPIRDISRHWHAGFLGLTAIPGLAKIGVFAQSHNPDPVATHPPAPTSGVESPTSGEELRVRDVSYRYDDAQQPVLNGLSMIARRGQLTAITGPSGAGKSTLFDVLLGFLTPDAGSVDLDSRPVDREDIAVVSQNPVLFAGSVRDNLAVAGQRSEEEMADACRSAGVLDEILALPQGFDAEVTEAGSSFSGGQRQRLAIARALFTQRPVLLVDEPTSALDATRAEEVIRSLHEVARERIVIMISHRPESLVGVEHILHLQNGQLERRAV